MESSRENYKQRQPTIIELLRRQYQVLTALPARHQHCVVKLERIDSSDFQAQPENGPNQWNGCRVHVRRRSELEEADETARKAFKIETEHLSGNNDQSASTSRCIISSGNVPQPKVKQELKTEDLNDLSDTQSNSSIEIIEIMDSDDNTAIIENTHSGAIKRSRAHRSQNQRAPPKGVTIAKMNESGSKASGEKSVQQPKTKLKKTKSRKLHKCQFCTYENYNASNFKEHVRIKHTGERPFKCAQCTSTFPGSRQLKAHLKRHSKDLPFECSNCTYRFSNENGLRQHIAKCLGKFSYECYLCGYATPLKCANLNHMEIHHFGGGKKLSCKFCGKNFRRQCHLKSHMGRIHSSGMKFDCSVCLQKFEFKREADSHEKNCKRRRFECFICRYSKPEFTNARKLVMHMRTHTGEKKYRCTECHKRFAVNRTLQAHLAEHAGKKPLRCVHCSQAFGEQRGLTIHEKQCKKRRQYECYICKRKAKLSLKAMKKHMQEHVKPRRKYKCKFCPKTFVLKLGHKYHTISMHGDPEQLKCKHCKEQFPHIQTKLSHEVKCIQLLQGKIPTKCSHCPREYFSDYQLKVHEPKCAKRVRYQCYLCGKMDGPYKIKLHMRIHTGCKPEKCSYCSRNFMRKSDLTMHIKRLHKEHVKLPSQMFKCSKCDRQFTQEYLQKKHERKTCKTFQCHLCGYTRKNWKKPHIELHMKSFHTGTRDHQCQHCPNTYFTSTGLRYHTSTAHSRR